MTQNYVHTLSDDEKVEFYLNKVEQILDVQLYEYDKFPGKYCLVDREPVLIDCPNYEEADSIELIDQILTYVVAETVQALVFETQEDNLALLVISSNKIITEKHYHRLLRTKIISRLKLLTNVDPAEKKYPQVGILNVNYRDKNYLIKILFFPQTLGESIVILPQDKQ